MSKVVFIFDDKTEKKLHNNERTDKERYLLSYKLETLRNINQ